MDTLLERLQQQLAQYGLNPMDWTIEPLQAGLFRVVDGEIELTGRACPIEGWVSLTLKSA